MKLTHPEKLYWPKVGITKGDLAAYYARMAPIMLPYLKGRPLSLKRYPEGAEGNSFFQKNINDAPAFVAVAAIAAKTVKKKIHYVVCDNAQTLTYLANLGALELHPWNSRLAALDKPDYLVFDLDPGEKTTFTDAVDAARALKALLDERKLSSFVKTSGKRGLHVYVPLGAAHPYEKVRAYARAVAQELVVRHPKLVSLEVHPKDRKDKIYMDYLRNSIGQTVVAPYCPRATPNATISAPLDWSEVTHRLNPSAFTMQTIEKRLAKKGDPWRPLLLKKTAARIA